MSLFKIEIKIKLKNYLIFIDRYLIGNWHEIIYEIMYENIY
jgi:hypothetical protein